MRVWIASSCPDGEVGWHVSHMMLLRGVSQVSDDVMDALGPGCPDGVVAVHGNEVGHSITCSLMRIMKNLSLD